MLRSMTLHSTDLTLYALFCLRRQTLPAHSGTLTRLTRRSASQTALDLLQLEGMGLAEASRVRLTMLGLARAAQLARASGDRIEASEAPRKALRRIKPLVAAKAQAASAVDRATDEADASPKALSA